MTRSSLWRNMPEATRLQLVPIVTTLVLVQAGATTAELIVRAMNGTPFGQTAHAVSATDIQGVLLLLNLVVVLWFARRALKEATDKAGQVSLDAKVIGLGTAFATGLELYEYATKSGHPERLTVALLLLFYVFVVPFFLVKGPAIEKADSGDGRRVAEQASATLELLLYAVVPCVGSAIACSAYYAVLNDGLKVAGLQLIPSITAPWTSPYGRTEFWCFNPGFLGVGWLMLITLFGVRGRTQPGALCLSFSGKSLVVLATVVTSILLAVFLIGDTSVIINSQANLSTPLNKAKAAVAVIVLLTFSVGFALARTAANLPTALSVLVQTIAFAFAGVLAGSAVVGIRYLLAGAANHAVELVALHAGGYTIAFVAGRSALFFIEGRFPEIRPILRSHPGDPAAATTDSQASLFWHWGRD